MNLRYLQNFFFDMKILSPHQIRAVDAYTIEHEPLASNELMERAASACARWILEHFDLQSKIAVFAGPGNNGGDGLAIARMLKNLSYDVSIYMLVESARLSPDALINYQRLTDLTPTILNENELPQLQPETVVIDALFGVGLSRPLDELAALTVEHINKSNCTVVAIDMPSGLFCDDNTENNSDAIIRACYTLTFQQPKLSFFFAENETFVGEWEVIDIGLLPEAIEQQKSIYRCFARNEYQSVFSAKRKKFAHKGDFGHACIIAGSHGMMGACVLATKACLRAGAGLVTAHIPKEGYIIMQTAVPEALISFDKHFDFFSQIPVLTKYSAIAVGPGIGKKTETQQALLALLQAVNTRRNDFSGKLVFDADALNIIAENPTWLDMLPTNSILTPHPKEFDRLAGNSVNGYRRHLKQIKMAQKYSVIIVLKGAYTSIATPDGSCFFNTNGNPGMATAGSGDVLTGIIVSLLAQGYEPQLAASAGVWIHGAAGDNAASKIGQQALIASDIIENLCSI